MLPTCHEQLSQQTSSKASMYRSIKIGYACEPYIQQTSNRHLRRILAQFRTGSHRLNIETGRHRKQYRKDRTCPMCTHRIINPGLPPEELMPLILMRSAAIPLRMSTMPSLIALSLARDTGQPPRDDRGRTERVICAWLWPHSPVWTHFRGMSEATGPWARPEAAFKYGATSLGLI